MHHSKGDWTFIVSLLASSLSATQGEYTWSENNSIVHMKKNVGVTCFGGHCSRTSFLRDSHLLERSILTLRSFWLDFNHCANYDSLDMCMPKWFSSFTAATIQFCVGPNSVR